MDERTPAVDPSSLTTQMVWREIESLRELLEARCASIEKSIDVAHLDLVRVPTDVQKQVGNLKELHEEKFTGIYKQFEERDIRSGQQREAAQTAVNAAFAAQEKSSNKQYDALVLSINKSEVATTKQIDGLNDKIVGVKNDVTALGIRVERSEGRSGGFSAGWGYLIAGAGLVATILTIVFILRRQG